MPSPFAPLKAQVRPWRDLPGAAGQRLGYMLQVGLVAQPRFNLGWAASPQAGHENWQSKNFASFERNSRHGFSLVNGRAAQSPPHACRPQPGPGKEDQGRAEEQQTGTPHWTISKVQAQAARPRADQLLPLGFPQRLTQARSSFHPRLRPLLLAQAEAGPGAVELLCAGPGASRPGAHQRALAVRPEPRRPSCGRGCQPGG